MAVSHSTAARHFAVEARHFVVEVDFRAARSRAEAVSVVEAVSAEEGVSAPAAVVSAAAAAMGVGSTVAATPVATAAGKDERPSLGRCRVENREQWRT